MKLNLYIGLFLLFFVPFASNAQCAMCRAVLESEAEGSMAEGINNGIPYLMVFPYLLIGGVGFMIYRMRKKAANEEN